MKFLLTYFCAFILVLTFSCNESDDLGVIGPLTAEIIPTGDENYLNLDSDHIFDQSQLHTFELIISDDNLDKLDSDPTAEEYVEGSLIFEGETISRVGVRYKGSVGAFVNCLTGSDWANPSGSKVCTKLSMKVKINYGGVDRKFYGLKKLQFHSQNLDQSQMHERLAYYLYRSMGVAAPRSVHARLLINGKYSGLYALTEQIDGRFSRQNFTDGTGNLYKEIWPLQMNGLPYAEQAYINSLATNEDENPSVVMMKNFATEVSESEPNNVQSIIRKWMDLEKIIAYAVVDRMIRADDGAFHWYCGGGNCTNHNYFWYEEPTEAKFYLIPWDMDNTFENIVSNANPVTPIADEWGEISGACEPFSYGFLFLKQRSAACDKLTAAWVSFEEEYIQTLQSFVDGPFSESNVNSLLDEWEQQILTATIEASELHDDAITQSQWESALTKLKNDLDFARAN